MASSEAIAAARASDGRSLDRAPTASSRAGLAVQDPSLPPIVVISSLFPSATQPTAGLFIRERMFRVARETELIVVSPQPWFPLQALIRWFYPTFRPKTPRAETQQGVTVLFPRFLAVPGLFRNLDGFSMALSLLRLIRRLKRERGIGIIDAHFAYPSGYAAVQLGEWLDLPVTITLRGTETKQLRQPALRSRALAAVRRATRVFSVSDSLRRLFVSSGIPGEHIHVIGNGVDLDKFHPIPRHVARRALGLPETGHVLVSVGGLVDRKGFHRVIALLPELMQQIPDLRYVIVGGPSPEGDNGPTLRAQVSELGIGDRVLFTGPLPADRVHVPLSAGDVFVLATANEGWANVFLEAMACGLPVVTTDVGGNVEVVSNPQLGTIVPFGDAAALKQALADALERTWDRERIIEHAQANTWDSRVATLTAHLKTVAAGRPV